MDEIGSVACDYLPPESDVANIVIVEMILSRSQWELTPTHIVLLAESKSAELLAIDAVALAIGMAAEEVTGKQFAVRYPKRMYQHLQ